MKTSRFPLVAGMVGLLAVSASGCGRSASAGEDDESPPSVLFVQSAASAEFDLEAGTLTLEGVDQHTLWFTDRPAHAAGSELTADVVGTYLPAAIAGAGGAPNAALVWGDDPISDAVAIEIDGTSIDEATGTVVYDVQPLTETPDGYDGYGAFDEPPAGAIADVHLFIDNVIVNIQACQMLVKNDSAEDFQISASDTHHPGQILPKGVYFEVVNSKDAFSCSGTIHMTGLTSGATLRIDYDNPDAGSNHVHMRCTGDITCDADRRENDEGLGETFVITGGQAPPHTVPLPPGVTYPIIPDVDVDAQPDGVPAGTDAVTATT